MTARPEPPCLLSRAKLPTWCKPWPDLRARFSILFGTADEVREYVFITDRNGLVRFEAEALHTPRGVRISDDAPVAHLPPDVLIAAGVEALTRAKRGWSNGA